MSQAMTPRRALEAAVAVVCIPSLLFWGVVAYLLRGKVDYETWPLYVVLAALPLPLCVLLYLRYKREPEPPEAHSRLFHILSAVLFALLSYTYLWRVLHNGGKKAPWFPLLLALGFLILCIENSRSAAKPKPAKNNS